MHQSNVVDRGWEDAILSEVSLELSILTYDVACKTSQSQYYLVSRLNARYKLGFLCKRYDNIVLESHADGEWFDQRGMSSFYNETDNLRRMFTCHELEEKVGDRCNSQWKLGEENCCDSMPTIMSQSSIRWAYFNLLWRMKLRLWTSCRGQHNSA